MDIIKNNHLHLVLTLSLIAYLHSTANAADFRVRLHQSDQPKYLTEDIETEIKFGRRVAARILGRYSMHPDQTLSHYINLIGSSLAMHAGRGELNYYFAVLDSDHANAYSTPGGYIFITYAAIRKAQDEAELAAILAHEIAHVSQRHVVKEFKIQSNKNSGYSALANIMGATSNTTKIAFEQSVDKAYQLLFQQGFKIEDELEADQVATLLLAETGYDPTALHRYLNRGRHTVSTKITQTHPTSEQRFSQLLRLIKNEQLHALHYPRLQTRFDKYIAGK